MNDDTTIINATIELSNDDLACTRGGLPWDPHGDPGGPTGRPDFLSPDAFRIPPGKLPDPRIVYPPYKTPGETPPIVVFPIA
ncbi:MAG: hypothetical protein ABW217_06145 [Polyangiaceae bacterium]